jgi:predicted KAP-like P-loop ATPase
MLIQSIEHTCLVTDQKDLWVLRRYGRKQYPRTAGSLILQIYKNLMRNDKTEVGF